MGEIMKEQFNIFNQISSQVLNQLSYLKLGIEPVWLLQMHFPNL